MRPSIIVATAVAGVLVAFAVVAALRNQPPPPDDGPDPHAVTGRSPAFHLDATPEQRKGILETAFGRIASDRPDRLGAIKDDIALLLDRDDAVGFVLARWHARRVDDKYTQGAFADLFRLAKRPEFVEPTAELLASPYPEIQGKAVQAAETQADPRLGPRLLDIYRAAKDAGDRKTALKLGVLRAAFACGGDSLPALLAEAFQDDEEEVAVQALTIAADADVPGAEDAAKRVLRSTQSRRVRLYAAALLARRGDLSAPPEIVAALDPRDPGLAAEALHLVAKHRIRAAAERVREIRKDLPPDLDPVALLALLRVDDEAAWEEVLTAADTPGSEAEVGALRLIGASGNVDMVPVLLHGLARGGITRIREIAAGISTSREPGFLPVIERLIEQPVGNPAELGDAPTVGGEALVPRLAELLRGATEPAVQARYLAWLAMAGGDAARDAIVAERDRIRRLADEQLRLVDLEARRLGRGLRAPASRSGGSVNR